MSTTLKRRIRRPKPNAGQRAFAFVDELKRWREHERQEAKAARKAAREQERDRWRRELAAMRLAAQKERARQRRIEQAAKQARDARARKKAVRCIECGRRTHRPVCIFCQHVAEGLPRINEFLATRPDPHITEDVKRALATCEISDESERATDAWIAACTARLRATWKPEEFYERAGVKVLKWEAPESSPEPSQGGDGFYG